MKRSSLTLLLSLIAVFLSGAVVGAVGYRLHFTETTMEAAAARQLSPEEWRQRYVAALQERLALTPEQLVRLNVILDQSKERFQSLENQVIKPGKKALFEEQAAAIMEMLDGEQKVKYQQWREERARMREERNKREAGRHPH